MINLNKAAALLGNLTLNIGSTTNNCCASIIFQKNCIAATINIFKVNVVDNNTSDVNLRVLTD